MKLEQPLLGDGFPEIKLDVMVLIKRVTSSSSESIFSTYTITEKEKNNPMIITKILFLLEYAFGENAARMFKPGLGHCNSHQYPCQDTNLCISMRKVCDCRYLSMIILI